ncbi:MAG: hypothetical protein LBU61_01160 [Coriobacteriales bacterium]|nr:hypothetical protein [Coriobacteriales bacterium]
MAYEFPGKNANSFFEWFTYNNQTIDGKSRIKAYALIDNSLLDVEYHADLQSLKQLKPVIYI